MLGLPIYLLAMGLLLLAGPALSRSTLGEDSAGQADVYWQVNNGEGHAGYLLGTIHSEDARVLEFTPQFLHELTTCPVFAMELVPDLGTMQQLIDLMQLPADQRLNNILGETRYQAVVSALARYNMPEEQIVQLKPWAVMMSLSVPPPKTGQFLDFVLSLRASAQGNQVVGLETLDEQLSFLEQLALEGQIELLDQALAEADGVQAVHDEMVTLYLTSNLEQLLVQAEVQMEPLDKQLQDHFMAEGIVARNHRMVEKALPLLKAGCTFIAVGALHLPGKDGLLKLLENKGYTLQPLPSPFTINQPAINP